MIGACSGFLLCKADRIQLLSDPMKNRESRRIVPASALALIMLILLFAAEALVIGGVLETRSSVIARLAPWAYEPFLKWVGEHPDSPRYRDAEAEPDTAASAMEIVAGFDPAAVVMTNALPMTNPPLEDASEPEVPDESPKDVMPVG